MLPVCEHRRDLRGVYTKGVVSLWRHGGDDQRENPPGVSRYTGACRSIAFVTNMPTQIGPYRADCEIGRGGMGVV